jgi:1,2-diacylglycerol 3-beta-galactosyltransferase
VKTVSKKKRILILTADAGFGHRNAARAIAEGLQERYGASCDCVTLNPIRERSAPLVFKSTERNYDRTVLQQPAFYQLTYDMADHAWASRVMGGYLKYVLAHVIQEVVVETLPDLIISTYQLYHTPVRAVLQESGLPIPFFTVVTDLLNVHQLWLNPGPDRYFVANEHVRTQALVRGLRPEQVVISGIPVKTAIAREQRPREELRRELGWDPDLPVLLAVGSRRVRLLAEHLQALNGCQFPFQLAVVAGGDEAVYQQLQALPWQMPVKIYPYVADLAPMLRAADALISKAGGLILSEALAAGLPTLVIDAIPGQETGNTRYLCALQAGQLTRSPEQLAQAVDLWLANDGALLHYAAQQAALAGHADAAYQIADEIWGALSPAAQPTAEPGPYRPHLGPQGKRRAAPKPGSKKARGEAAA